MAGTRETPRTGTRTKTRVSINPEEVADGLSVPSLLRSRSRRSRAESGSQRLRQTFDAPLPTWPKRGTQKPQAEPAPGSPKKSAKKDTAKYPSLGDLCVDFSINSDLENLLVAQLQEYAWQRQSLENVEAWFPPPPVPDEAAKEASNFQDWRRAFVNRMLDIDRRIPRLDTRAYRMQREVIQAVDKRCGHETMFEFVRQRLLRRQDTLRSKRVMLQGRISDSEGVAAAKRMAEGSGSSKSSLQAVTALLRPVDALMGAIEQELAVLEQRIGQARSDDRPPQMSIPLWSSGLIVLIREVAIDDMATGTLRSFLQRVQYMGLSQRSRLWRRSLELNSVAHVVAAGESSPSPTSGWPIPLGITSRRVLESALQELGPAFGCSASLQSDKGKTFSHQVAMTFPHVFQRQQQRLNFQVYPGAGAFGASPQLVSASVSEGGHEAAPRPSSLKESSDVDTCFLRPSGWTCRAPWRAKIDPRLLEQGVIMKASHAAGQRTSRMQHEVASYARQLLESTMNAGSQETTLEDVGPWQPDIDSVLAAERAFLEVEDVKMVTRRLNDSVEKRAHMDDLAGTTIAAPSRGGDVDGAEPLKRAYYMLRHLQCRDQRWKLLQELNFFRFVQRRLLIGYDESQPEILNRPSRAKGKRGTFSDQRAQERYWDLSPAALVKVFQDCQIPNITGGSHTTKIGAEGDTPSLDRERLTEVPTESGSRELIVFDEAGRRIMHAAALQDLQNLEREMLSIGSYYMHKYEAKTNIDEIEKPLMDRTGVLLDLFTAEVWFNSEKRNLLEVYLEIYEHTPDLLEKHDLAQRMIDVMARRPQLDLGDAYFTDAYSVAISVMKSRSALLRRLLHHQIKTERSVGKVCEKVLLAPITQAQTSSTTRQSSVNVDTASERTGSERRRIRRTRTLSSVLEPSEQDGAEGTEGEEVQGDDSAIRFLAHPLEGYNYIGAGGHEGAARVQLTPAAEQVGMLEFCCSASLTWKAELLVEEVHSNLVEAFHPPSVLMISLLERVCYDFVAEQWRTIEEEAATPESMQNTPQRDPNEHPDLLVIAIREAAFKLTGAKTETQKDAEASGNTAVKELSIVVKELGGCEVDGHIHHAYTDLRRRCGHNTKDMFGHLLENLLEYVHLRRTLGDVTRQVMTLERVLATQSISFGARAEASRPRALSGVPDDSPSSAPMGNPWIHSSCPTFSAGMLHEEMGVVDSSTARGLMLQCAGLSLAEMRQIYQHELAFRDLVLACVQYNTLILDPQVRQKEITDVGLVGPSRDMMADGGAVIQRKLRITAELSGEPRGDRRLPHKSDRQTVKNTEKVTMVDHSRYTHLLQTPMAHMTPILKAVSEVAEEKLQGMKIGGQLEGDRHIRTEWNRLASCSSILVLRKATDLAVRVQAVHAAHALRIISALIPSRITPFDISPERQQPFMDKDGFIGNIFAVPTTLELIQLRGINGDQGITDIVKQLYATSKQIFDTRSSSTTLSPRRLGTQLLIDLQVPETLGESLTELHTNVVKPSGPAFDAARLLHSMIILATLRYGLATVDGDPLTMIRIQSDVRIHLPGSDASLVLATSLTRTEPTTEALEDMCSDLSRVAIQLEALGEAGRNPEKVMEVLQLEVQAAHREFALILRLAAQECLMDDSPDDFAELSQWIYYVEGPLAGAARVSRQLVSMLRAGPLVSLPTFASHRPARTEPEHSPPDPPEVMRMAFFGTPEIAELQEDGSRYLLAFHPQHTLRHPNLHAFLHMLLAGITTLSLPIVYNNSRAAWARLPWQQPPPPLLGLTSALCLLSPERRKKISAIRKHLLEKRDTLHQFTQVRSDSNESARMDVNFFGTFLLMEILKECVVSGHLATPPPRSREEMLLFHSHFEGQFSQKPTLGEDASEEEGVRAQGQQTTRDLQMALETIPVLATSLDQLLASATSDQLACKLGAIVEHRHRTAAARSTKVTPAALARLNSRNGNLSAAKVDSVLRTVCRLRERGTFVHMDRTGSERAYVLNEEDINECTKDMMRSLASWGFDVVRSRERLAKELLACASFRAQTLKKEVDQLEQVNNALQDKNFSRQRDAHARNEVTRRGCSLIFEVDRLHRALRDLKVVSQELEYRLSSEIWDGVRESIGSITAAVVAETGKFREDHAKSAKEVAQTMRTIREHVTASFAELAAKNHSVQVRATQGRLWDQTFAARRHEDLSQEDEASPLVVSDGMCQKLAEVARRDDTRVLLGKIEELNNHTILIRAFNILKRQATRQKFDQQMHALQMTLDSNKDLFERLQQSSRSQEKTANDFVQTATKVSQAELQIEELRVQVELNTEQKHRLQSWQRTKARQLAYVDNKVKEHQRFGAVNVEGMQQEVRDKAEQVKHLEEAQRHDNAKFEYAIQTKEEETSHVRNKLKDKREVKEKARLDLQQLRKEFAVGGPNYDERVELWRGRLANAQERVKLLEDENLRLKALKESMDRTLQSSQSTLSRKNSGSGRSSRL